jgi:hypothetical protein
MVARTVTSRGLRTMTSGDLHRRRGLDGRRVDPTAASPARPTAAAGNPHRRHDPDQQWTAVVAKDGRFSSM